MMAQKLHLTCDQAHKLPKESMFIVCIDIEEPLNALSELLEAFFYNSCEHTQRSCLPLLCINAWGFCDQPRTAHDHLTTFMPSHVFLMSLTVTGISAKSLFTGEYYHRG